jgi:CNT family concentrative nucleoside transporter
MAQAKSFLFLLFALLSLSVLGQENASAKWSFKSITDIEGSEIIAIDSSDYLIIDKEGKFEYSLKAKNSLFAQGAWVRTPSNLVFSYSKPIDTVRSYLVITENDTALTLNEGNTLFHFSKKLPVKINPYDFKSTSVSLSSILRGILGLTVLVFIAFIFSSKRKKINWWLVLKGLVIQVIFALAILKVEWVRIAFEWVSQMFVTVLSFTDAGSDFLFGSLVDTTQSWGYIFAFKVLPTVVFFSALTSLFFYLGIIQKLVYAFAWIMKRTLKLSGAESLAAAGNVFLGQTESPLLVKPYIGKMTKSEILCLMCGGMATIAGGVLAAYIGFLGGSDPEQQLFFAEHLLAASLMSAPAAIVAAKILRPETQEFDESMRMEDINVGSSALEAVANGTTDGLKLALNVGAMLLVFTALMYMGNYILSDIIGHYTGLNDWVVSTTSGQYSGFSFQFILGYILAPLTWLMGVASEDTVLVGQLLGEKTILNEFYAYASLGDLVQSGKFASSKSIVIATYILCGFANFASIGIQIGGIGSIAPSRRSDLAKLGFQALIGGTLASLFTAVIVGMLI